MVNRAFGELCKDYLNNRLTPEELEYFLQLIQQQQYRDQLQQMIDQVLQQPLHPEEGNVPKGDLIFQKIMNAAAASEQETKVVSLPPSRSMGWWKIAAAIILVISGVIWFFLNNNTNPTTTTTVTQQNELKNDVLPGGDKAVLILADGSVIVLDSAQNGMLTQQGTTLIKKQHGKLVYDASHPTLSQPVSITYNTLSTPRGGQYHIILPDGSSVWLNAASSLCFPTAFTGKERKITISGEAYVEVVKNPSMPFMVEVNNSSIQVLGTQFNIMAYKDEAVLATTLVEGSLKFVNGSNIHLLQPGQQSQLTSNGTIKIVKHVDVSAVVAWKNGAFHFEDEDLGTIARQLSRWYDVEMVYDQPINDLFTAEIPRHLKLSDALKALELTGKVRFTIEGKKVRVTH